MSKYGHRFTRRGYECQECDGNGINETYADKLCARAERFYSFQPHALMCETCAGNGWLTGTEFKQAFGISPSRANVSAQIVSV